jgi:two-component system, NarL family, response regulator DesR
MIRVLLAEDQALVRGALAALLELEPDIEVIFQAQNGQEALTQTKILSPDVVLTDIEMPLVTGLELCAEIQKLKTQNLQFKTKVIIVTTFARAGFLRRALEAGAVGYLLKDAPASELAQAVRRVMAGARAIDPNLAAEAWSEADPLTDRERQALRLAAEGKTSFDIAKLLGLSEGTVRNYLSEAISKLGADNRIEAARIAREKGWL